MRFAMLSMLAAAALIGMVAGSAQAGVIRNLEEGPGPAGPVVHLYTANAASFVLAADFRSREAGRETASSPAEAPDEGERWIAPGPEPGTTSPGTASLLPPGIPGLGSPGESLPFGEGDRGIVFLPAAAVSLAGGPSAGIMSIAPSSDDGGTGWSPQFLISPEPGTFALFGTALLVLAVAGRRRSRRRRTG